MRFVVLKIAQFIYGPVYRVYNSGFKSRRDQQAFLCSKSIQTGCGVHPKWKIAPGIKWPRRVAHCSPSFSFELMNEWNNSSTPHIFFHGMQRDKFSFTSRSGP